MKTPTAPYSVIVRASTGIHKETANCGHKHKTIATAQACYDRLTAWRRDGFTSARWYHARIEGSNGEVVFPLDNSAEWSTHVPD